MIKSILNKSIVICFILGLTFNKSWCQALTEKIEIAEVIAEFDSRGYLFSTNTNGLESGFEYPKGSNNSTIFASSYWLRAVDSATNTLHTSVKTYPNNFDCIFEGPIRNAPFNDLSSNGIYKLSKNTVIDFNQNYGSAGYIIPSPIINWPGNGNVNSGISKRLAPFIDLNNNGDYEPISNGEYPYALGQENLYFINNDLSGSRTGFNSSVSGLDAEIHSYAYELESEYEIFKDCIFLNVVLKNRSQDTYKDVYLGLWFDFDIGGSIDDHIGCDSSLNIFYGYNADNTDDDYLNNIPAQGVMLLNRDFSSFIGYNNSANAINGNPQNVVDFDNLLLGYWKNGNAISQTGNGTDSIGVATTKFLFNHGTNQESGPGNDKRALGSIGPLKLSPGESECFDLVVFPAIDSSSVLAIASIDELLNKADTIKKLFNLVGSGCGSSLINAVSTEHIKNDSNKISVYPNPSKLFVNIQSPSSYKEWTIKLISLNDSRVHYTDSGKNILNQTINLETINRGFYILQIQTDSWSENFKILIHD